MLGKIHEDTWGTTGKTNGCINITIHIYMAFNNSDMFLINILIPLAKYLNIESYASFFKYLKRILCLPKA